MSGTCAVVASLFFVGALPVSADNEDVIMYLDSREACAGTQDRDYEIRAFDAIHIEGAMLLDHFGMRAIEYDCEFDAEIKFDWSGSSTQMRAGYCAEPEQTIYPQTFVIGMSQGEPDVALVWSSADPSGQATRFYACHQMQ